MSKSEPKTSKLQDLKKLIEKRHGEGAVMLGKNSIVNVDAFPTMIATLDRALGCGGLPQGRILEIYGHESSGKTTTCLQFIKACQNHFFPNKINEDGEPGRTGVAAMIDAEHALDPQWAENMGVDIDKLMISQPNSGEEAFDILETMVKSGLVDLIVIDSVAALVPKCILEGEFDDANIGAQARLMSKGLGRVKAEINKSKCVVVFINQIRMKIGVMFGCLHGDTLIDFVDGRSIPIREVVLDKIGGDVWSYNVATKTFEPQKIIDWHINGYADNFIYFTLRGPGTKNGTMQITVTPNHKILTSDNIWVEACDLTINDTLITKQPCYVIDDEINGTIGQFLTGVLSGDSNISKNHGKLCASLKIRDNIDSEYMKWKVEKLSKFIDFKEYKCPSRTHFVSSEQYEFVEIKEKYKNRDPMLLLNNFSFLGFAIWIMDDAVFERKRYHLSIKRFAGNFAKLEEISNKLDELNLYHYMSNGGRIIFDVGVSSYIAENIKTYVPECMDRKLPKTSRNQYIDFDLTRNVEFKSATVKIVDIRDASNRQMRQKTKYDISIANNSCYMAGGNPIGVIVHNSPEDTPGGKALKFYSSVRMQINKGVAIKNGDTTIGYTPKIKIVKNRVAAPFTTAEFDICFGKEPRATYGIDELSGLLTIGKEMKIVSISGTHYKLGDTLLGNGFNQSMQALHRDDKLAAELREQIYNNLVDANLQVSGEEDFGDSLLDGDDGD